MLESESEETLVVGCRLSVVGWVSVEGSMIVFSTTIASFVSTKFVSTISTVLMVSLSTFDFWLSTIE